MTASPARPTHTLLLVLAAILLPACDLAPRYNPPDTPQVVEYLPPGASRGGVGGGGWSPITGFLVCHDLGGVRWVVAWSQVAGGQEDGGQHQQECMGGACRGRGHDLEPAGGVSA